MSGLASDLPIVFEEVGIAVGNVTILDRISIRISPGAPTVLIGPNGSGKTTFLRAAMGLLPPSRGRITWGGREASAPTRRAIVFQRPVMLRRSVAGNPATNGIPEEPVQMPDLPARGLRRQAGRTLP